MTAVQFNVALIDYSTAACRGIPTEMFMEWECHTEARRVCAGCPVAADCYFEAVRDDLSGTWGGCWFGKPGRGARDIAKGHTERMQLYRAILCERIGISIDEFIRRYGKSQAGMRTALRRLSGLRPHEQRR